MLPWKTGYPQYLFSLGFGPFCSWNSLICASLALRAPCKILRPFLSWALEADE